MYTEAELFKISKICSLLNDACDVVADIDGVNLRVTNSNIQLLDDEGVRLGEFVLLDDHFQFMP